MEVGLLNSFGHFCHISESNKNENGYFQMSNVMRREAMDGKMQLLVRQLSDNISYACKVVINDKIVYIEVQERIGTFDCKNRRAFSKQSHSLVHL